MDDDPRIRIAVNRLATGKLPQGDPRWGKFNDSFVNQQLEPSRQHSTPGQRRTGRQIPRKGVAEMKGFTWGE